MPKVQNKLIVIEGLDGSGKTTQLNLLKAYFSSTGQEVRDIHFPMLNQGYFGKLIARFLRGEFGSIDQVHPQLTALLFAEDRKEHIHLINQWLEEGYVVILDRYVNSNIAFQCAKCSNEEEKQALKEWILDFEYNFNSLPQPLFSLYLDVPFEAVQKSLTNVRTGEDRAYLQGQKDIHEDSLSFQQLVMKEYLKMTDEQPQFYKINCFDSAGNHLPAKDVHENIKATLNQLLQMENSEDKTKKS